MRYVLRKGRDVGFLDLYQRMRSKNACKTCALGMGGQSGGMVNEAGHFPEVCKKSVQAQAADMGRTIDDNFFAQTTVHELERLTSAQAEALGRLTFPVILEPGENHFRRVSWDQALDAAGDAFRAAAPDETFWYSSGRSSNEAAYLFQLVARTYGTNNVSNCSFYCHQASGGALHSVYGSGTASMAGRGVLMISTTEFPMYLSENLREREEQKSSEVKGATQSNEGKNGQGSYDLSVWGRIGWILIRRASPSWDPEPLLNEITQSAHKEGYEHTASTHSTSSA
jgi:hypothetical protein